VASWSIWQGEKEERRRKQEEKKKNGKLGRNLFEF
jgi:hypothetical protein